MKARRVALGCAILVLGGVGFALWLMPGSELALLKPIPAEVRVISIESTTRKPKIDLTLPFLGQVTYPKPVTPPFPIPEGAAGILVRAPVTTPPPPPGGSSGSLVMDISFLRDDPRWTVGEETLRSLRGDPDFVVCPRVFGKNMRDAIVTTEAFGSSQKFHLRLPCNDLQEPALPAIDKSIGDWRLSLTPRPWISPSFPIRYAVRCSDGHGAIFLIKISNPTEYGEISLRASDTRPGLFDISNFNGTATLRKYQLRVTRLAAKRVTLHAIRGSVGVEEWIQLVGLDRKALVWMDRSSRAIGEPSYGYAADQLLQVGDYWPTPESNWAADKSGSFDDFKFLETLRDGQEVEANVYTPVEERSITFTLDLPDPNRFLRSP